MRFGKSEWSSFESGIGREWLLTNGIGGFSSSTVIGANSRRYHGLLVASLEPPVERRLILSQLHETVVVNGREYSLSSFSTGNYINMGYLFQASFELDLLPVFTYVLGDIFIEKSVSLVYGENTAVISYRIIAGSDDVEIKVAPLVNFRDYHGDSAKLYMKFSQQCGSDYTVIRPYELDLRILVGCPGSSYEALENCWFEGMYYPVESERGLNAFEDHYIPGIFRIAAKAGSNACFYFVCTVCQDGPDVLASRTWNAGGYMDPLYGKSAIEEEKKRIRSLTADCSDDFHRMLVRSADHFIVNRRSTGSKTIIAGYPWFTDWGRDTMISLPGLTLATGRYDDAADILAAYSRYVRHGLVPNMFPDEGSEPGYNTVDAALWYFEAIGAYVEKTGDTALVKKVLYDSMLQIIESYMNGTLHGIRMDDDMLITAGSNETQLTWMDAKVGDWVVTPRHGKAVEINALWYNAVMVMSHILKKNGKDNSGYARLGEKIKESFLEVFWNEQEGCLYDVVNENGKDGKIRPNQILAVSLPFPVLEGKYAKAVVDTVYRKLYTAYGLRTLCNTHPEYRGFYVGDQYQRDGAYHQGTVWVWPLGQFITAFARVYKGDRNLAEIIKSFFIPFYDHLNDACIGNISEIFDGNEPLVARGCFAQAWSVSEIIRSYVEDYLPMLKQ